MVKDSLRTALKKAGMDLGLRENTLAKPLSNITEIPKLTRPHKNKKLGRNQSLFILLCFAIACILYVFLGN